MLYNVFYRGSGFDHEVPPAFLDMLAEKRPDIMEEAICAISKWPDGHILYPVRTEAGWVWLKKEP